MGSSTNLRVGTILVTGALTDIVDVVVWVKKALLGQTLAVFLLSKNLAMKLPFFHNHSLLEAAEKKQFLELQ